MKRFLKPCLTGIAAALLSSFGARAQAASGQDLPSTCLVTHYGHESVTQRQASLTTFSASLPETGDALTAGETTVADPTHHLHDAMLLEANRFAALGALLLEAGRTPRSCDTAESHAAMRAIARAVVDGAKPELHWQNVVLSHAGRKDSVRDMRIRAYPEAGASGQIGIAIQGTGISTSSGVPAPSSLTVTLSVPVELVKQAAESGASKPVIGPGETLTIHNLDAAYGQSEVHGHGVMRAGTSWRSTQGELHLEVAGMSELLQAIHGHAPTGVSATLAVAQFMGHRTGNNVAWDVVLRDGVLAVNNIPLPISLP